MPSNQNSFPVVSEKGNELDIVTSTTGDYMLIARADNTVKRSEIPSTDNALLKSGGTMTGDINCNANKIQKAQLYDTRETAVPVSIDSGYVEFDFSLGNIFYVTLSEDVTSISFSHVPPSGQAAPITIEFTQDGTGGRTVAGWPAAVTWRGGTVLTMTATANAVDVVVGYTRDGGTTYRLGICENYA